MPQTLPPPWRELRRVQRTGSTNDDLAALAAAGEPSGLVLVADEQTAGRGRLDRRWQAPLGTALTFSVLVRTPWAMPALGAVPLAVGAATAQALRDATGVPIAVKWPNDLVHASGKVGGVLVRHVDPDGLVIGVGINTTMGADDLPVATASSLALAGAAADSLDPDALLAHVLERLGAALGPVTAAAAPGAAHDLLAPARALSATVGSLVEVHLPGGTLLLGRASAIDDDGALVVEDPSGSNHRVTAGDVVHLRTPD